MTVVRVAIPLLKGKRRFHLSKGRPWSIVEHVILVALAANPRTVADLATESELPRRLILEVLIRLMRAGWVVLAQSPNGVIFSASKAGSEVVDDEELPHVSKPISRWMNFAIDKITGTLYRSRELPFFEKHVLEQRAQRERLVWMESREISVFDETAAILSTLFEDDEKFIGMEPSGDRLVDRYALVSVRNGTVEGLPSRAPRELEQLVLQAASDAPAMPVGDRSPKFRPAPLPTFADSDPPPTMEVVFDSSDLILGGQDHEEALTTLLKKAKRRIVLHSTFIAEGRFIGVRPHLYDAAKRGVLIDILWGENEEKSGVTTTRATVGRLRQQVTAAGLESNLRIHPFSSRSHAKIIVADEGRSDRLFAILGSCNWLSSGFQSFDASVRLRDPRVVAAILEQIAELTRGSDGHWTELTNDMVRMADETRRQSIPSGSRAQIAVVLGPQHAYYVRKARDNSSKRIFVTSHRLGAATRPAVIVPAIAAAMDRGIEVKVYYGIHSGGVSNSDTALLTTEAAAQGVQICPVSEPRLHAKLLAWDDDNLVVTSQNWLSADPSEANLRREIGLFIQAHGVARTAIDSFEAMRRY